MIHQQACHHWPKAWYLQEHTSQTYRLQLSSPPEAPVTHHQSAALAPALVRGPDIDSASLAGNDESYLGSTVIA
jgi:hypothetical protein